MMGWAEIGPITAGFLASLAAGLATGVGCLPGLFLKAPSDRMMDTMLGFAAGVMVAASAFELITPSLQIGGLWTVVLSVVLGVAFVDFLDRAIPHAHFIFGLEGPSSRIRRVWLLVLAFTIHNIPEGLSVGVSFGLESFTSGTVLAIAIGLQNIPEGLAVALPLEREGYSEWRALSYATLTGLVEPVAGLVGASVVSFANVLLPQALAFAAGAMLYVVFDELIPESHSRGNHREATFGAVSGFLVMMILDNFLSHG
jgi:ZIP family zinc transporter